MAQVQAASPVGQLPSSGSVGHRSSAGHRSPYEPKSPTHYGSRPNSRVSFSDSGQHSRQHSGGRVPRPPSQPRGSPDGSSGRERPPSVRSLREKVDMSEFISPVVKSAVRRWKRFHEEKVRERFKERRASKREYMQAVKAEKKHLARRIPIDVLALEWLNNNEVTIDARAYLLDKLLPTLILGIEKLLMEVEKRNLAEEMEMNPNFNPVNYLAQYLMRNNPKYSNFPEASPYIRGLNEVTDELKNHVFSFEDNRLAKVKADARRKREDLVKAENQRTQERLARSGRIRQNFQDWLLDDDGLVATEIIRTALSNFSEVLEGLPEDMKKGMMPLSQLKKPFKQEKMALEDFVEYLRMLVNKMGPDLFNEFMGHMTKCAKAYRQAGILEARRDVLVDLFKQCDHAAIGIIDRYRVLGLFGAFFDKSPWVVKRYIRNPRRWPVVELDEVGDDESSISEESFVSSRMSNSSMGRPGSQADSIHRPNSVPPDAEGSVKETNAGVTEAQSDSQLPNVGAATEGEKDSGSNDEVTKTPPDNPNKSIPVIVTIEKSEEEKANENNTLVNANTEHESNDTRETADVKTEEESKPANEQGDVKTEEESKPADDSENVKGEEASKPADDSENVKTEEESKPADDTENVKTEEESKPADDSENVKAEEESKPEDDSGNAKAEEESKPVNDSDNVKTDDTSTLGGAGDVKTEQDSKPEVVVESKTEQDSQPNDETSEVKTDTESKPADVTPEVKVEQESKTDEIPENKSEQESDQTANTTIDNPADTSSEVKEAVGESQKPAEEVGEVTTETVLDAAGKSNKEVDSNKEASESEAKKSDEEAVVEGSAVVEKIESTQDAALVEGDGLKGDETEVKETMKEDDGLAADETKGDDGKETLPHTAATGRATAVSFNQDAIDVKEKKQGLKSPIKTPTTRSGSVATSAFDQTTLNMSQFVQLVEVFLGEEPAEEVVQAVIKFIQQGYVETEEEKFNRLQIARRLEQISKRKIMMDQLFDKWDNDGSGYLDLDELHSVMSKFKENMEKKIVGKAKQMLDKEDNDHRLSKTEFKRYLEVVCSLLPGGEDNFDPLVEFLMTSVERSYEERIRGQARKKWLAQIQQAAETSGASMEPVYKSVFNSLYKDSEQHGRGKRISANVAMLERNDTAPSRGGTCLRYVASTPDDSHYMLNKILYRDMKGISFTTVDSGKPIHVPRVQNHGNIMFWNPERSEEDRQGSFIVIPLKDHRKRVFGTMGIDTLNDPQEKSIFITHEISFFQGVAKAFSSAYQYVDIRRKTLRIAESAVAWIHRRSPHVLEISVYIVEPDDKDVNEFRNRQQSTRNKKMAKFIADDSEEAKLEDFILRRMLTTDKAGNILVHEHPTKLERKENLFRDYLFKCVDNSETVTADAYGQRHIAFPLRDITGHAVAIVDLSIGELKHLPSHENKEVQRMLKLLQYAHKEVSAESEGKSQKVVLEAEKNSEESRIDIMFDRIMLTDLRETVGKLNLRSFAELKSYKDPPKVIHDILVSVLSLFYQKESERGELEEYHNCKQYVNPELIKKIEEFDPTALEAGGIVDKVAARLKEVPHGAVAKHGSLPAQHLYNWAFVCLSLLEHTSKMKLNQPKLPPTDTPPGSAMSGGITEQ